MSSERTRKIPWAACALTETIDRSKFFASQKFVLKPLTYPLFLVALLLSCSEAMVRQSGQAAGLLVARQVCAECHAVERSAVSSPHGDAPNFSRIANARGMTAKYLSVEIRRAHEMMPNINLNADELRNVIAYILSLRHRK